MSLLSVPAVASSRSLNQSSINTVLMRVMTGENMYTIDMPHVASKQMLDMDLMIDDEDMALLAGA